MKINVVLGAFLGLPPGPTGAHDMLWFELCRAFSDRGHDVTLIYAGADDPDPPQAQSIDLLKVSRHRRASWMPANLFKDFRYSWNLRGRLPMADVTVTNTFWMPILLGRKRLRGALVVSAGRWPHGQYRLYESADLVAAVSSSVANAILNQAPSLDGRVEYFVNPVQLEVFKPRSESVSTQNQVILYSGRIHPEKGLGLLIEAYAHIKPRFPDSILRLVGPIEPAHGGGGKEYLMSLLRRFGNLKIEVLPPEFDRHRLADMLRDATAYCYPSIAMQGEACPVAPMEAMACGLPVIVSNLPQFNDYMMDGVSGLMFDHTATDAALQLANHLCRVLEDAQLRQRLSKGALASIQRFSTANVADRYLAAFAKLLNPKQQHAFASNNPT